TDALEDPLVGVADIDLDKIVRRRSCHDPDVRVDADIEIYLLLDSDLFGRYAGGEVLEKEEVARDALEKPAELRCAVKHVINLPYPPASVVSPSPRSGPLAHQLLPAGPEAGDQSAPRGARASLLSRPHAHLIACSAPSSSSVMTVAPSSTATSPITPPRTPPR